MPPATGNRCPHNATCPHMPAVARVLSITPMALPVRCMHTAPGVLRPCPRPAAAPVSLSWQQPPLAMCAGLGKNSPTFEPHPSAPPGLMWPYRKPRRYALYLVAYDIVLPFLVVSLGMFFSISTLVLLFQVGAGMLGGW